MNELNDEIEFMKRAASHFAEHPEHSTFGDLIRSRYSRYAGDLEMIV